MGDSGPHLTGCFWGFLIPIRASVLILVAAVLVIKDVPAGRVVGFVALVFAVFGVAGAILWFAFRQN